MIGYKAFNSDLTCRGYQYEVGKIYTHAGDFVPCRSGFHFCKTISDCYKFYDFGSRICKVEALGEIKTNDDIKYCTNKIAIIEEIVESDIVKCNTGKDNTGCMNSGNYNSGNCSSGDYNSGNWNNGNYNSGDYNSGDYNSGNYSSGDYNSGNWNNGNYNSGNYNSGDYNSGNYNSGDYNNGNWNSGDCNNGNRNSGNWNNGDYNSGNCNSGYYNLGSHNTGVFNTTDNPTILMFDKPTEWTLEDFRRSEAYNILLYCPFGTHWISTSDMTEEEKTHETTGGYIKPYTKEDKQKWWDNLDEKDKDIVKSLPNFNEEKFIRCMDIYHI